jgi:hypothetical protein
MSLKKGWKEQEEKERNNARLGKFSRGLRERQKRIQRKVRGEITLPVEQKGRTSKERGPGQ